MAVETSRVQARAAVGTTPVARYRLRGHVQRRRRENSIALDALVLLGAYLYGSLPLVYQLARRRNVDLKRVGSGNVGATNLLAAGGRLWAVAGWVFDASKGLLPVLAARRLGRREGPRL